MNESLYLLTYLPLILNGISDVNNSQYSLLLLLCELSACITSFEFNSSDISYLSSLIADFLEICHREFPILSITVKFHHMVHYPRMIELFGPLRFYNTINFESHHSFLKSLMKTSKNWTCPVLTIAKKYARFSAIPSNSKLGSVLDFNQILPHEFEQPTDAVFYSRIYINGIEYSLGKLILYSKSDCLYKFLKIDFIFSTQNTHMFVGKVSTSTFNENLNCFILDTWEDNGALEYGDMRACLHCYTLYKYESFNYIVCLNKI